jgi:hypothetical protein
VPLVEQQAVIYAEGSTFAQVYAELERQMAEMPPVRIISISSTTRLGALCLGAVVETV